MGYREGTDASLRADRHNRLQRREAEKEKQEAANILVDLSENVPPVEQGNTYVQSISVIICSVVLILILIYQILYQKIFTNYNLIYISFLTDKILFN